MSEMRRGALLAATLSLLCAGAGSVAAEEETFDVKRCIGGNCKNGRIRSITVTPDYFIVIIDPDRCRGRAYCPTSYDSFRVEGEVPVRVQGYEPGTPTNEMFGVYVPRAYKTLYIDGIGKHARFASLDLSPYERHADVKTSAGSEETSEPSELTQLLGQGAAAAAAGSSAESGVAPRQGLAVVFGIEDYRYAPDARFASNDAEVFRDYLMRRFGFDDERILFRLDGQATVGEFDRAFSPGGWLGRQASSRSDVLIFFAGHGAVDSETGKPMLLPHDADPEVPRTAYPLEELLTGLDAIDARSVTVIFDTSFSGMTREHRALREGGPPDTAAIEGSVLGPNTLVFLAAGESQSNVAFEKKRHGLFTYYFLKGVSGEADTNEDGRITGDELDAFLGKEVPRQAGQWGREQNPVLLGSDRARAVLSR
jgi:ferredoxin